MSCCHAPRPLPGRFASGPPLGVWTLGHPLQYVVRERTLRKAKKMNRLLIPLDLSGHYDALIDLLKELRWGPEATLLHVIEEIRGVPDAELEDFYRSLEERALPLLEGVAEQLAKAGVGCELDIRRGRRAEVIIEVAAERGSRVILLTSHPARRESGKFRAGSTSHQVALAAPCSVFLLRQTESQDADSTPA